MTLRSLDGSMLVLGGGDSQRGLRMLGRPRVQEAAKVANLTTGTIFGHRGGSGVYPENTLNAFEASAAKNIPIEMDVWETSDGVLVVNHDQTADRTTNLTGNVSSLTAAQWDAGVVDAGSWFLSTWGNLDTVRFSEALTTIAGRSAINVEVHSATACTKAIAAVQAAGVASTVIFASWIEADLAPALAAGFPCMLIMGDGTSKTPSAVIALGMTYVALQGDYSSGTNASAATISSFVASGLKVVVWEAEGHYQRNYFLTTLGCWGVFTSQPLYNSDPSKYRRATDPFDAQTFFDGQYTGLAAGRGAFTSPDWLTIPASYAGNQGEYYVRQGWGSPVPSPAGTYQIDATMKVESVSDTTRFGGFHVCSTHDRGPKLAATSIYPGGVGYGCIVRANGALAIYKITNATPTLIAGPTGSTAIPAGSSVPIRVTVTPTQITLTRTDNGNTITATDNTYRGGYWFLGKSGEQSLGLSYKDVTVS